MSGIANRVVSSALGLKLPAEFLNAYEIQNADKLSWKVALYKVERADGQPLAHKDRSDNKGIFWDLYRKYKSRCQGAVFIIDVNHDTVAVPAGWNLPSPEEYEDFIIYRQEIVQVLATNPQHQSIVVGLIREGLKRHFKNNNPEELGPLWQDFGRFCQQPQSDNESGYSFCRRFDCAAKVLRGQQWVIEFPISTTVIDNRSFADYYQSGNVKVLAEMIEAKRAERVNRQNQHVGTRVLRYFAQPHGVILEALKLSDEDAIFNHAQLSEIEQKKLAGNEVRCLQYPKTIKNVPFYELRLILGSQNTQEDHAETIISPGERERLMRQLYSFIDGVDIYGQALKLASQPFDTIGLESGFELPPAVCVNGPDNQKIIIQPPNRITEADLHERTKNRSYHIRRYGFVVQRPINPLLAFPRFSDGSSAQRMQEDLNYLLDQQGIDYRFKGLLRFHNVDEIRREVERNGYDSAVVVLPSSRLNGNTKADLHEQVKQGLEVPSQCIMLRNTMPKHVTCSLDKLYKQDRRTATRIQQRYEMVILNLLVKHHWLPFLPVEGFHYNVQVGLDVGGQHNTNAVSCLGYGFSNPKEGLIFRPDAIPTGVAKSEPIPTGSLFTGLLKQFEIVHAELAQAGLKPNFERVLFIRDGHLRGDVERPWNETDDLLDLHRELLRRNWITNHSVWTALEVRKVGEDWRLFRGGAEADNPLAGRYVIPYENENIALVCTTGAQHLTQGTANPLILEIINLHGRADRKQVIRDIIWGADMCFTKPDIGMRLPWVLHVADSGALQQAKSYKVTGITV